MSSYTMNEEQFKILVKAHSAVIAAGEDFRHLVCSLIPPDECRKTPEAKEDSPSTSTNTTSGKIISKAIELLDSALCELTLYEDAPSDVIGYIEDAYSILRGKYLHHKQLSTNKERRSDFMRSYYDSAGRLWVSCSECERGYNGSDKDKCSSLGCYVGTIMAKLKTVPGKPEEINNIMEKFNSLIKKEENIPQEFVDAVNDDFWDLVE